VYRIPNAKRCFGAPYEWGTCLRPYSSVKAGSTEAGVPGIKVIAFDSEKSRACWLTAMRLAKVSDAIPLLRPRSVLGVRRESGWITGSTDICLLSFA
jgi:hypothetical protein